MSLVRVGVGAAAVLLASSASWAATVEIPSGRDNTIYNEGFPVSNGAGDHMFAGNTGNAVPRRALIWFDIASAVPVGATIESVALTLNMSRTNAGAVSNALHRLTSDWGEAGSHAFGEEGGGALALPGDVTWADAFWDSVAPTPWTTPGGDFIAAPSASITVGGLGFYTWGSTPGMVADAQAWLDDPSMNFGWIIIGSESGFGGAKRFDTKDNTEPAVRPKLVVTYSMGPAADLNGDGFVNGADLATLLANWGPCPGCDADLTGDDVVNGADLAELLANWT